MENMFMDEVQEGIDANTDLADAVYKQYQQGVSWLDRFNFYGKVQECYDFYEGDQWKIDGQELQTGGERFPVENIIEPIVNYKVATICMNTMGIALTPLFCANAEEKRRAAAACTLLEKRFQQYWEMYAMDSLLWETTLDAAIAKSAFLYLDENCQPYPIDETNVFLGDEQEGAIQKQPYILIKERLHVDVVKREAEQNGLSEEAIAAIRADNDTDKEMGDLGKHELNQGMSSMEGEKVTSLFKLWRGEEGYIHVLRATKDVVYQPERVITGLSLYPVVKLTWKKKKGSARGRGEVETLIANQIQINKNIARRVNANRACAYPRLVYDQDAIFNPQALANVGAPIAVNGSVKRIDDIMRYLSPQPMGSDAKLLGDELVARTQDLASAGEAALGATNPEKASGAAIVAARDQAQIPLSWQKQCYYQFVEDIARCWFGLTVSYHPNGMPVTYEDEAGTPVNEVIDGETLSSMQVKIRVDVSSINPFSKMVAEEALQSLFTAGAITFEEFVDALDDGSNIPKAKLKDILEKRKTQAMANTAGNMPANQGGATNQGGENASIMEVLRSEHGNAQAKGVTN